MSVNDELRQLSDQFADKKITRRQLWKGAAGLGLSAAWIAALEKGALAGPAPLRSTLRAMNADDPTTLIIAVAENVDTFDPAFTVGSKTSQTVIQNTWDQLTQYAVVDATAPDGTAYKTVDTEKIVAMIASDWKYDGNDIVYTVRQGATYSNGDPIDAKVIEAGYNRIFTVNGSTLGLLEMGGATTGAADFVADDATTFRIKMTKPNTLIAKNVVMHNTSALDPVELAAKKTDSDPGAADYYRKNLGVGNGPYKLDSYKPDDSVVLVTNDTYYGTKPFFTKVILKIVADANQRVTLLEKGDVDGATKIAIQDYTNLKATAGVQALSIPSNLVEMLEMNATVAPFDKKEVRQAFAYATPYQDITDQIYLGQATPAKSLVPTGMPTSDQSSPYVLDLEKAKALLVTAGYPDGKGLPDINLTISADDPQREKIAILMKDSLSKINVNLTIQKLPYAQFNQLEQSSQLQIWTDEWISWVNDPFYHVSWLATSTSPTNYPKFKSDRADALIAQYTLAPASPERDAASKEIQGILFDECPYIFLNQPNWIVYFQKDIQGYVYYNDELPRYYLMSRATA